MGGGWDWGGTYLLSVVDLDADGGEGVGGGWDWGGTYLLSVVDLDADGFNNRIE